MTQMVCLVLLALIPHSNVVVLLIRVVDLDCGTVTFDCHRCITQRMRVQHVEVDVLVRFCIVPTQIEWTLLQGVLCASLRPVGTVL